MACGGGDEAGNSPVEVSNGGVGGQQVAGAGSGGTAGEGGGAAGEGGVGGSEVGGAAGEGATVRIHLAATTAEFPHSDGLSGQTPISHVGGIRKYQLFKDKNDTKGVPVFDLGNGFVEASYDNGADTVVAEVPLNSIPEGLYTRAQVVHTHVRYRIKATAHNVGYNLPGEFNNVQVMSDHTVLEGVERQSGYYLYKFTAVGTEFPMEGQNAPIPIQPDSGGFSVSHVDGQWIYEFPVNLNIKHQTSGIIDITFQVNMFESFRWQDEDKPDYTPKIFDVTATSFEPVKHFGANSFSIFLSGE